METVIFLIESPHMKHEHCFAVKVDKKEDIGRDSVDSHGVTGKFDGSCDDIDPHMGDEMMGAEEEMPMNQTEDKVNQIRALALEGIQDFAEQVDSEEYQFYKKVWMLCDKMCSEKEKMSDSE